MVRKANIARRIARDARAQLTLRRVLVFVVGTAVGLALAFLITKSLGWSLPWWLWAVGLVGVAFMWFVAWLRPEQYNEDAESAA